MRAAIGRWRRCCKGSGTPPRSLDEMPLYTDWRSLWREPYVECKFAKEGGLLKPYADLAYRLLWGFHLEGRLHTVRGEYKGRRVLKFWLD